MADISWSRKHRPSTLEDYMGDGVKSIIENRFWKADSKPNVVLFQGTRGCGKTSAARLLTKEYLCLNPVEGHSCGQCEMCKEIEERLIGGEFGTECTGVVEIDATHTNGKDAITEIIEEAMIPPVMTKYKVLIFDECHMISNAAQNALLKILEEPPEHLVILFCTTDPDKMLQTVKSRCLLTITVKKPTVDALVKTLMGIAKKEGVTTSGDALRIIAKKADRVPREAINIMENVAKSYDNMVIIENVREVTRDLEADLYMEFFESANKSLESVLNFNLKMKERDIQPREFLEGLAKFVLDCLYVRHAISIEDYPVEYVSRIKGLFKTYETREFDLLLQVVEKSIISITNSDYANEVLIINTAMRVSKIPNMVRNSLKNEKAAADKETDIGMARYAQILRQETEDKNNSILDNGVTDVSKSAIANIFKSITTVDVGAPEITLSGLSDTLPIKAVTENNGGLPGMSMDQLQELMGAVEK